MSPAVPGPVVALRTTDAGALATSAGVPVRVWGCEVSDRAVPTEPGWWWRMDWPTRRRVVAAFRGEDGVLAWVPFRSPVPVEDDGIWVAPVLTPDEAAALRARAEAAEAACERMGAVMAASERDAASRGYAAGYAAAAAADAAYAAARYAAAAADIYTHLRALVGGAA